MVTAGVTTVIGSDMAAEQCSSGLETRGWGAGGQPGSQCHCLRGAGGCFEAGEGIVVVVVNDDGIADGGCAGVVSGDTAALAGKGGLVTMWLEVFRDELGGSVDVPAFFRSRDSSSLGAVCIAASIVVVLVVCVLEFSVSMAVVV